MCFLARSIALFVKRKRNYQISILTMFALGWSSLVSAETSRILLDPAIGPQRTVVEIKFIGSTPARVLWDAGLPTERFLESNESGTLFSVPPAATAGDHPVAIETDAGRSNIEAFKVTPPVPLATPRVDDVMLFNTHFAPGVVETSLYVQGANVDVGAKVIIDGVEFSSKAQKALKNKLFGADETILRFPIRHYVSHVTKLGPRPKGSIIGIQFRNEAGEMSAVRKYRLPQDPTTLDSDGDGISDLIELNGYDNGSGSVVDLRAAGADPYRKDVFVKVDVMEDSTNQPLSGMWSEAQKMFEDAPLLNRLMSHGINLVIDTSTTIPPNLNFDFISFIDSDDPANNIVSFDNLREIHFPLKLRGLYHYAIWGKEQPTRDSSGQSNVCFCDSDEPGQYNWFGTGDRFMITLDGMPTTADVRAQAETFVHELGHNLGQRHGGNNHSRYKPNYWSTMSYSWQLRALQPDSFRLEHPTCTQIYYGVQGTKEGVSGELPVPLPSELYMDYSEGMAPTLKNNSTLLDKNIGVCGLEIDWTNVIVDEFSKPDVDVSDYANWPNLKFNGPSVGFALFPLRPFIAGTFMSSLSGQKRLAGQNGSVAVQHITTGQAVRAPSVPSNTMKNQPAMETRSGGAVLSAEKSTASQTAASQAVRYRRIESLLKDLEKTRGLELGTIIAAQDRGDRILLRYDLRKLKDFPRSMSALPFATDTDRARAMQAGEMETTVDFEYRDSLRPNVGGEQLALIRQGRELAGNAYSSGNEPVSISIASADISAHQLPGTGTELPVVVRVGAQTIQLMQGQAQQIGTYEIRVRLSSNRSAAGPRIEGAAYSLDLQIRPSR